MSEIIEGLMNIFKSGLIVTSRKIRSLFPKKHNHHSHTHH